MAENKVFIEIQKAEETSEYKVRITASKDTPADFPLSMMKPTATLVEYKDVWSLGKMERPEFLEVPMTLTELIEAGNEPRVEIRRFLRFGGVIYLESVARFLVEVYYSDPEVYRFPFESPLISVAVSKPKKTEGIGEEIAVDFITEDKSHHHVYKTPDSQEHNRIDLTQWLIADPKDSTTKQTFKFQRKVITP